MPPAAPPENANQDAAPPPVPSLPLAWRHFAGFQPYEPLLAEMQDMQPPFAKMPLPRLYGFLSIRRFIPVAHRQSRMIFWHPEMCPFRMSGAAANGPGTGRASVLPMLCLTSAAAVRMCAPLFMGWKAGSLPALPPLALPVNGATVCPESGLKMAKATAGLIKLRRLASASAAGSAGMALRLILIPIWPLLMPSCHAASMMAG